jgi:hypothetical protein
MKSRMFALLIGGMILFSAVSALAHHSFGGTYDVDKKITLKGTMAQIALRSPHSFFYVDIADAKGKVERWAIEGAGAGQFAQQGVDKNAFKIGDVVEIVANPSRTNSTPRARLIKITRPSDGKSWGTGAAEVVD